MIERTLINFRRKKPGTFFFLVAFFCLLLVYVIYSRSGTHSSTITSSSSSSSSVMKQNEHSYQRLSGDESQQREEGEKKTDEGELEKEIASVEDNESRFALLKEGIGKQANRPETDSEDSQDQPVVVKIVEKEYQDEEKKDEREINDSVPLGNGFFEKKEPTSDENQDRLNSPQLTSINDVSEEGSADSNNNEEEEEEEEEEEDEGKVKNKNGSPSNSASSEVASDSTAEENQESTDQELAGESYVFNGAARNINRKTSIQAGSDDSDDDNSNGIIINNNINNNMNTQGETPNNNNNAQLVRDLNDLSIVTSKLPLFPLAPPETEDESLKTETEGFVEPYVIPGVDDENTHWLQPKSYRAFLKTSPFKFINTILADEINKVRTKMSGGSTPEFEYLRLWMQQRPVNFPWGIASDKVVLQSAQSNAHNIPYAICLTGDAEAFLEPFILRTLFHRLIFGLGGTPVIFLHNHYSSFVNLEELKELATMLGVTVLSSEPNVAEDEPGWENTCQKFPKSNNKDFNTLRGRQKCFNLIERYERLNGYRFHYIIQSQINLVWLTPMKSLKTFGPESIHMSNGGSRVSEHFAILPRHYASNFFSAFNMYLKCDDSYDPINIPYSNSLNHLLLHTIARSNRPPQRHTSIAHASWDPQNGIDCAAVSANTISLNLCLQVVKKMKGE